MFSSVTSRVSSLKQWIFMYSNGKMTAESHSCNHQGCSHNSKAYSEPIPMRSLCQHQPLYEKSIFPCWCLTFCCTENILWCTESKEPSICGTKQDRIFCWFSFFSLISSLSPSILARVSVCSWSEVTRGAADEVSQESCTKLLTLCCLSTNNI